MRLTKARTTMDLNEQQYTILLAQLAQPETREVMIAAGVWKHGQSQRERLDALLTLRWSNEILAEGVRRLALVNEGKRQLLATTEIASLAEELAAKDREASRRRRA